MSEERQRRKSTIKAIPYKDLFEIPVPSQNVARAFRAICAGVANDVQQKAVMEFIVNEMCRVDDMEFRPESQGGYAATGVAAGKRFIGQQIRALLSASGSMIERLPS